jgi:elongation factor G
VLEKSPLDHYILDGLTIPEAVYVVSIEPNLSSQYKELEDALAILCLEDPSLHVTLDKESNQLLVKGEGTLPWLSDE